MATEIQGIAQSDVLIRTAIVRSLERLYENPSELDHIFHSLAEDEETRAVYGEKQIELAKNWFLTSNIPVMMAFRVAEEQIPCITISLQESVEAEQTHGDIHYQPQEETAGDWPVLSPKFTPLAYSPTSGIMVLPAGLMGDQLIAPGMFVLTRDGRKYEIVENLGDDEIALAPYTTGDFVNATIKGSRMRYVTTIESVLFKETYQIGIHVQNEPAYLLYLHAIVKYCLLKYKQDLLEKRGFERSVLSSTDFRRNQEFDVEEVFSRFINITGFVRQSWSKDTKPMIDVVNLKDPDTNTGLVISAAGHDTDDEDRSVNEDGSLPDGDDPWSVIPSSTPIVVVPPTSSTPPVPPPDPSQPPAIADIGLWFKGDVGLSGAGGFVTLWEDQGPSGLDATVVDIHAVPQMGNDNIDGIPCIDFGLLSSDGACLGNPGLAMTPDQPRTVFAMVRPRYAVSGFGITGGAVFTSIESGVPIGFDFATRCEFDSNFGPNRYYVFGSSVFNINDGPSTVGGLGGPFDGVPTLCEWMSTGYPDLTVVRNGTDQTVTPANAVVAGPSIYTGFIIGNSHNPPSRNFYGSIAEIIVWFKVLNPTELLQAREYMALRYPSAPIV